MAQYRIGSKQPQVDPSAFVTAEATLIGDVILGPQSSIWPGAVLRGDNEPIRIGQGSNVQEGAVLHADPGFPCTVGQNVTVGHQVMLHGCTIGDGSLVGIQAVVMNGAVIGRNCIVGAGALVTEGKQFPDNSLIMGTPAKVVRELSEQDLTMLARAAKVYSAKAAAYPTEMVRID